MCIYRLWQLAVNFIYIEERTTRNYKISGDVGFVSKLNDVFSAEKSKIVIHQLADKKIIQEYQCDEMTYELRYSYIMCIQGTAYVSFDLKTDKITKKAP